MMLTMADISITIYKKTGGVDLNRNISILKKENKKLINVLEDETSVFMLFIFHGKENYAFSENIPFEFPEPDFGAIKEDDFAPAGRIYSYTPKEMKETLERSELKMEISSEKILGTIKSLEKAGYIEAGCVFIAEKAKRYYITEKGYILVSFLVYSINYPGQNKKEGHNQF